MKRANFPGRKQARQMVALANFLSCKSDNPISIAAKAHEYSVLDEACKQQDALSRRTKKHRSPR
jgi:hypothetical protein